jgi:regulator of sigma E protease
MGNLSVYVAPLLVFGLVVFVHELGHFLAAKLTGVYAPVFSLGWGRRVWGIRRGETDYRLSLIPLGGYVRMASRDDDSLAGIEGGSDRGSFDSAAARPPHVPDALWDPNGMAPFGPKPVPAHRWTESKSATARVFILSAGVLMNIVLTIVVNSGISLQLGKNYVPAVVDSVVTDAPAARAGLQSGDRITAINNEPVASWNEVVDRISAVTTGAVHLTLARGDSVLSRDITPQVTDGIDRVTGATKKVGRIGVSVRDSVVHEPLSATAAVRDGVERSVQMADNVFAVLKGLFSGEVSAKNLGGPIAIAKTSVQAARGGADMLWSLIAFLSINIAILNLVPIPVLDGGQILMVLAERIKGGEFSMRTREAFARVGVLAVLALIVLVTFNDVRSFFTR